MEVLSDYERNGYTGQFAAREGGDIKCFSCGERIPAAEVHMDSMRRVEGVSDPADMNLIGALECPHCGARGTAVFRFGPDTTPEDAAALTKIEDVRDCLRAPQFGLAPHELGGEEIGRPPGAPP